MINIKNTYKKALDAIWNNPKYKDIYLLDRGYAVQQEMSENAILYMGINPSIQEGEQTELSQKERRLFYDLHRIQPHKYFQKFIDIAGLLETRWTHTDLLFCRETNQKKVEGLFKSKEGLDFINQQLQLSRQMIEDSKPTIIVVNNTLARRFLGFEKKEVKNNKMENVWLDYDFEFDGNIGTYRIKNNDALEKVPIFFSSMFTGGRALDLGSLERLVWQMRRTIIIEGVTEIESIANSKQKAADAKNYERCAALRGREKVMLEKMERQKGLLNKPYALNSIKT